jgi:hypothetical protein
MNTSATASLSDLFVFPFRGKDWAMKLLIAVALSVLGALLLFIPSVFVFGYLARLMRRVIAGHPPELPAWEEWWELFASGLKVTAAGLIYSLPSLMFIGIGYTAMLLPSFAPLVEQPGSGEDLAVLLVSGMFAGWCALGVGVLFWLAALFVLPVAIAHLVARDSFMAAFSVRELWQVLRANLAGFLVAFLLVLGLFGLMYFAYTILFLTIVLCILAPLVLVVFSVYQLLVGGALYADAYREAVARKAGARMAGGRLGQDQPAGGKIDFNLDAGTTSL